MQVVPPDRSPPAQMTRSGWNYIPYMVWVIKICIYPFFSRKIWKFALRPMETSNGYNSGTVKDRGEMFVPKGVFGVAQFNGVVKIYSRSTLVAMVTNRLFLDTKLAITRLIWELQPRILHEVGVFAVTQFNGAIEIYLRPTLVAMVTKTREFLHKISYDSVYVTGIAENPAPNGGFRGCTI